MLLQIGMNKRILAGIISLLFILGCQESKKADVAENFLDSEMAQTFLDSLSFEVVHPDVIVADSLLRTAIQSEGFSILDSLAQIEIGDPYLEFYINCQNVRNDLREMSNYSADSLFKLRTKELDELKRKPLCLQLQMAFLSQSLSNYGVDGFNFEFPTKILLSGIEDVEMSQTTKVVLYSLFEQNGNFSLFQNFDPYRARDFYGSQDDLIRKGFVASSMEQGRLYYYLGEVFRQLSDFELAVDYANQSIQSLKKTEDYNFLAFSMSQKLNNLAILGKVEQAEIMFNDLRNFSDHHNISQPSRFMFLRNYIGALNYSKSIAQTELLIPILENETDPKDTFQISELYEHKSWIALEHKKFEEAISYYKYAIDIYEQYSERELSHVGKYYSNLGSIYFENGQVDSSLIVNHKGMQIESGSNFNIGIFPGKETLDRLNAEFFNVINFAVALQNSDYPTGSRIDNIELAEQYYQYLIDFFDEKISKKEGRAMLRDLSDFHDVFGKVIGCKMVSADGFLAQGNEIFSLMEKSKALLLQSSVDVRALADQIGIPDEMFEELLYFEEEIADIETDVDVEFESDSIKLSYLNLLNGKNELLDRIEILYPSFIERTKLSKNILLEDVQKNINSNEVLIQYHWTDKEIYIIAIAQDDVQFRQVKDVSELTNRLTKVLTQVQMAPSEDIESEAKEFLMNSKWLDSVLISGLYNDKMVDHLIIIPDGALGKLPFEILTSKIPKQDFTFFDIEYLIRRNSISYGFSSSLFFQQRELDRSKRNPEIKLFAYSDQAEISNSALEDGWGELPSSGRAVDDIQRVLSSYKVDKWKGKNCTKNNFIEASKTGDIIHLALHGQSDPRNRWGNKLIFKGDSNMIKVDKLVYGYELRGMKMNNSLVFISACESGKGKIESGEGVYSLGRNFAGAGVPAVVMGLWNLNDDVSSKLVVDFYSKLKTGAVPATALQFAKNKFLMSADDRLAHPYYWAPTVAIGGGPSPFK